MTLPTPDTEAPEEVDRSDEIAVVVAVEASRYKEC
jgi:hypothetical protein